MAELYVIVDDENDNAPRIMHLDLEVSPDTLPNKVVGKIEVYDADGNGNGKVHYYLMGGGLDKFRVDVDTGILIVTMYTGI